MSACTLFAYCQLYVAIIYRFLRLIKVSCHDVVGHGTAMSDKLIANFGNRITESTGVVASFVRTKDLPNASRNLAEIKSDAAVIIKKLKLRVEQLESMVKLNLTKEREIKEQQYLAEQDRDSLQKENDEIKYKMERCKKAMESTRQSLQQSEYLYRSAESERREKGEKAQELRDYWFVPGFGQYLMIREAFQQNGKKAEEARREAARHRENCRSLENEIATYENELKISDKKINDNERNIRELSDQCNELHRQTGDIRNAIDDLKRTVFVREEQSSIAIDGLQNTENLDKKLAKAIDYKEESQLEKFCNSHATHRSVKLFTDTWKSMLSTEYTSNLSISFTCISCGCFKTGIPFYNESNKTFTCEDCYEKQRA